MNKWRFIDTGLNNPQWNMSIDEALLSHFEQTKLPILRLYQWEPSLSFGRFSKIADNINIEELYKNSIPYVRRITGGGILVHGGEISYTLVLPRTFVSTLGVKKAYQYLCSFIINFYKNIGLHPQFAIQSNIPCHHSEICLVGNESYDILVQDKKIGANAQRHTKNAILQHGCIPIEIDKIIFSKLFLKESGIEQAQSLSKLGINTKIEKLKELLLETFCETFKTELFIDGLNEHEVKYAKKLYKTKYNLKSWNMQGQIKKCKGV